ncbi:MAG: ethanolamine utilization protein EutJ [Eubacterium sp.]|nr:ethanolamine utilization protein EutJ [Eubacterium sp.]
MNDYNNILIGFSELIRNEEFLPYEGNLKLGVDLGTANIVLSVVDENDTPIAGATYPSSVVRDGIVVDFMGASRAVRNMKAKLEEMMGVEFHEAATAIPPGIISGNVKVISNVVESVGLDVINVVDEPTAAASVLGITEGAVVDVGGGTTGISILKNGEVIFTADEPTGGTHMSLVLAGSLGCSFEEAERIKKDPKQELLVFPVVKPVIEKMAAIVARFIEGYDVDVIYVVGGACSFKRFEEVFEKQIGVKTLKPKEPLLVTPLGIAMNCIKQ